MPKRYVGTFLLGRSSATEDIDGAVTVLPDPPIPAAAQIEAAAEKLVGSLLQRPPAFSALKVAGQRAYDLARRGEAVELKPRPIEVYALKVARYDYPELVLEIECSGGTYVRSLGRDLAESLGTAAVMSALVRTAIGPWTLDTAVDPRTLTAADWQARLDPLGQGIVRPARPRVDARRGCAGPSRPVHSVRRRGPEPGDRRRRRAVAGSWPSSSPAVPGNGARRRILTDLECGNSLPLWFCRGAAFRFEDHYPNRSRSSCGIVRGVTRQLRTTSTPVGAVACAATAPLPKNSMKETDDPAAHRCGTRVARGR